MWSATYMQRIYQETKKNRRREKKNGEMMASNIPGAMEA